MNENVYKTFDLLPGIWCIVDVNSRYLYVNREYIEMVGAQNFPENYLLGKTVNDIPCNASQSSKLFWKADELVKASKKMVRVLHVLQMADNQWRIFQIDKKPILDAHGNVEAIIFNLLDYTANHMLDLALVLAKDPKYSSATAKHQLISINKREDEVLLKQKESECLFYLIRGFSYKEIAQVQNVVYSTIVDHIERLKIKFNASTTEELISLALAAGYPKFLPQKYFTEPLSIMLS